MASQRVLSKTPWAGRPWSDAQDRALRRAIDVFKPPRPLGQNSPDMLRQKWEGVAASEGVRCSAEEAFERAVHLGWRSYPPNINPPGRGGAHLGLVRKPLGSSMTLGKQGGSGRHAAPSPVAAAAASSVAAASAAAPAAAAAAAAPSPAAAAAKRKRVEAAAREAVVQEAPQRGGRGVRPEAAPAMRHLAAGLGRGLDEKAFAALWCAALDHYAKD